MAKHFASSGYRIKLSTRSQQKQQAFNASGLSAYLVDIDQPLTEIDDFLSADILIINITSKNIDGFHRLRESINASPVQQVLFISSSSVYQNLSRAVSEDEGAENPGSLLYQIENLFREATGFTTTIVRFSGLVGAGRHPGRFFRDGKQLKQPDAPINLIHFDDCIGIIDSIIQHGAWGEVFNGCSDSHPSKRDFYSQACALAGFPLPAFDSAQTLTFKIVCNNKIKQLLGYRLRHPDLLKLHDYGHSAG